MLKCPKKSINYWVYAFDTPSYLVYIGKSYKDTAPVNLCTFVYNTARRRYWFIPFYSVFYELWRVQYALNGWLGIPNKNGGNK